jgi:hypothetical protein
MWDGASYHTGTTAYAIIAGPYEEEKGNGFHSFAGTHPPDLSDTRRNSAPVLVRHDPFL